MGLGIEGPPAPPGRGGGLDQPQAQVTAHPGLHLEMRVELVRIPIPARVRKLLGVRVVDAAVAAVGVVVHEELHVRLLRLQPHRSARCAAAAAGLVQLKAGSASPSRRAGPRPASPRPAPPGRRQLPAPGSGSRPRRNGSPAPRALPPLPARPGPLPGPERRESSQPGTSRTCPGWEACHGDQDPLSEGAKGLGASLDT